MNDKGLYICILIFTIVLFIYSILLLIAVISQPELCVKIITIPLIIAMIWAIFQFIKSLIKNIKKL